jgi:cysteine desulfurase/selenocysteine lyase
MIYLNNGSTTWPKPPEVIDAVTKFIRSMPNTPGRDNGSSKSISAECRERVNDFLGLGDEYHFAFTSGSTEALNLALKGCGLEGRHVVATVQDHNATIRPLKTMEQAGEITLDFVKCDSGGYVEPADIEAAITPETGAIVLNHCSNVTGAVQDAETIGRIAEKHGLIFILDASQSAGAMALNVSKTKAHFVAITGHKSLYGTQGIGGLCIRRGAELKPLKQGGTGTRSDVLIQPGDLPYKYEAGTQNMPGIAALNAGIKWIQETGFEKIIATKKTHIQKLVDELGGLDEVTLYRKPERDSGTLFTFNFDDMVPEEMAYILQSSYGIKVRAGLHCAPLMRDYIGAMPFGTVRVSPSYFTTEEELDKFTGAVKELAEEF